jgi:hypothetical protein
MLKTLSYWRSLIIHHAGKDAQQAKPRTLRKPQSKEPRFRHGYPPSHDPDTHNTVTPEHYIPMMAIVKMNDSSAFVSVGAIVTIESHLVKRIWSIWRLQMR